MDVKQFVVLYWVVVLMVFGIQLLNHTDRTGSCDSCFCIVRSIAVSTPSL